MIKRHIQTPIGHRVVEHNGVLYFGGLISRDLGLDMEGQTRDICARLDDLLAQTGSSRDNLLTAMIYISDFSMKDGMNKAWLGWIAAEHLPTRATIGVAELGENVLVEIVISAVRI